MAKLFNNIRKKIIAENQSISRSKNYLKYAIGEIILVMVGILLALQVSTWNEQRKFNANESLILKSIINSINNDLRSYDGVFERRLELKRKSIDTLLNFIVTKTSLNDSVFMNYFNYIGTDIVARIDSGPYDALKSGGLNQISNPVLREQIVNVYQVKLPSFVKFSEIAGNEYNDFTAKIKNQLLVSKIISNSDGKLKLVELPKNKYIISNPLLLRVLFMEKKKYENFKIILNAMKKILKDLKSLIQTELNKNHD